MADDPKAKGLTLNYPGGSLEMTVGALESLFGADSDILNPETARLSSISTYNYNTAVPPFSLGTVAGFLDNAGAFSRFFVMSNVAREGEPNVNELSKVVADVLSKDIDLVADSRENNAPLQDRECH